MKTLYVSRFHEVKTSMPGAFALRLRVNVDDQLYETTAAIHKEAVDAATIDIVELTKRSMFNELMGHVYEKELKGR